MIETILMNALEEGTGVPAFMEMPENPPQRFFVIEKTGGGQRGYQQRTAVMAVQSYGESLLSAAQLNEQALDLLRDLAFTEETVITCEMNSSYNFTDTRTKRYRYQAVFDLVYFA